MPAARIASWAAALYALWWLLVGSWSPWIALWGAGVAVIAAVATVLSRGEQHPGYGIGRRWLPELGRAAVQVLLDFGVVVGALATAVRRRDRTAQGRFVTRQTDARGSDAVAQRAWISLAATWSPNAFVVELDPKTGRALFHHLRPWRRSEEPV